MIVVFVHHQRPPEIFRSTQTEIVARAATILGHSKHTQSHPPGVPLNDFTLAWHALTKGLRHAQAFDDKEAALAYYEQRNPSLSLAELGAIIQGIRKLPEELGTSPDDKWPKCAR